LHAQKSTSDTIQVKPKSLFLQKIGPIGGTGQSFSDVSIDIFVAIFPIVEGAFVEVPSRGVFQPLT
jgi:hypothetical protein